MNEENKKETDVKAYVNFKEAMILAKTMFGIITGNFNYSKEDHLIDNELCQQILTQPLVSNYVNEVVGSISSKESSISSIDAVCSPMVTSDSPISFNAQKSEEVIFRQGTGDLVYLIKEDVDSKGVPNYSLEILGEIGDLTPLEKKYLDEVCNQIDAQKGEGPGYSFRQKKEFNMPLIQEYTEESERHKTIFNLESPYEQEDIVINVSSTPSEASDLDNVDFSLPILNLPNSMNVKEDEGSVYVFLQGAEGSVHVFKKDVEKNKLTYIKKQ